MMSRHIHVLPVRVVTILIGITYLFLWSPWSACSLWKDWLPLPLPMRCPNNNNNKDLVGLLDGLTHVELVQEQQQADADADAAVPEPTAEGPPVSRHQQQTSNNVNATASDGRLEPNGALNTFSDARPSWSPTTGALASESVDDTRLRAIPTPAETETETLDDQVSRPSTPTSSLPDSVFPPSHSHWQPPLCFPFRDKSSLQAEIQGEWRMGVHSQFQTPSVHDSERLAQLNPQPPRHHQQQHRLVPLFGNLSCPFEWSKYDCTREGRADSDRIGTISFEPVGCRLLPFDRIELLQLLAGRRLVFFGDSTSRQHFISLACMLWASSSHTNPNTAFEDESESYDETSAAAAGLAGDRGPVSLMSTRQGALKSQQQQPRRRRRGVSSDQHTVLPTTNVALRRLMKHIGNSDFNSTSSPASASATTRDRPDPDLYVQVKGRVYYRADVQWSTNWPCHDRVRCLSKGPHSGFERACAHFRLEIDAGSLRSASSPMVQSHTPLVSSAFLGHTGYTTEPLTVCYEGALTNIAFSFDELDSAADSPVAASSSAGAGTAFQSSSTTTALTATTSSSSTCSSQTSGMRIDCCCSAAISDDLVNVNHTLADRCPDRGVHQRTRAWQRWLRNSRSTCCATNVGGGSSKCIHRDKQHLLLPPYNPESTDIIIANMGLHPDKNKFHFGLNKLLQLWGSNKSQAKGHTTDRSASESGSMSSSASASASKVLARSRCRRRPALVYREHAPQHFHNSGGEYASVVSAGAGCAPDLMNHTWKYYRSFPGWRVAAERSALLLEKTLGIRGPSRLTNDTNRKVVSVDPANPGGSVETIQESYLIHDVAFLRVHDAMRSIGITHVGPGAHVGSTGLKNSFALDCTHWCQPGPIEAQWTVWLYNLITSDVLEPNFRCAASFNDDVAMQTTSTSTMSSISTAKSGH